MTPRPARSARELMLATTVLAVVLSGLIWRAAPALAQSPEPGATAGPTASPGIIGTGDPRSEGEGPGLVGSPVTIALGVVALGLLAAGGTMLYLRLTRDD